jgi:hypothetical protein
MKRLRRRLFNFAAVMSLMLSALALAIECTGGFVDPSPRFRQLIGRWTYLVDGSARLESRLMFQLVLIHHSEKPIVGPVLPMGSSPELDAWLKRFPMRFEYSGKNAGLMYGPSTGTDSARRAIMNGTRIHILLSFRWIELALLVLPAAVWLPLLLKRKAIDPNAVLCRRCGYDLRATPDRCPECGDLPGAHA